MEKLIQSRFIFKSSKNEIMNFNENEERVYKQILLIEQLPEYNKFLEDFFNTYKPEEENYRKRFKPLVSRATFKFSELEEEKLLSVVIAENVSTRKLHLEHLENLNKSVSLDLEVLYRCLDELKPKKRNVVIQFFSRL